jgi:F-type H+-transporting ATPase subunit gamma
VELGLRALMMDPPPELPAWDDLFFALAHEDDTRKKQVPVCAFVFGSQQGLSGQFNEQIMTFSLDWLESHGIGRDRRVIAAMDEQVSYRLEAAGETVDRVFALPVTMGQMPEAVDEMLGYIGEILRKEKASEILLFYHKSVSGAAYHPQALRLFPPDPAWLLSLQSGRWPGHSLPAFTAEWRELFSFLMRELLLVTLERTFTESLLSENSSRLIAMQVAEKNIGEHLDELHHEFNSQRQSEITMELIDIVAGAEALRAPAD